MKQSKGKNQPTTHWLVALRIRRYRDDAVIDIIRSVNATVGSNSRDWNVSDRPNERELALSFETPRTPPELLKELQDIIWKSNHNEYCLIDVAGMPVRVSQGTFWESDETDFARFTQGLARASRGA